MFQRDRELESPAGQAEDGLSGGRAVRGEESLKRLEREKAEAERIPVWHRGYPSVNRTGELATLCTVW